MQQFFLSRRIFFSIKVQRTIFFANMGIILFEGSLCRNFVFLNCIMHEFFFISPSVPGIIFQNLLSFPSKEWHSDSPQLALELNLHELKNVSFQPRMKLYHAFIVLHLNYCAESWHFCSKRSADKLEKMN